MPFMLRCGHVEIDIPEGISLVWLFLVPQNPIIEDRKAAVVLNRDHASQLRLSDNFALQTDVLNVI